MQTEGSPSHNALAFEFVQGLAGELNRGTLELPSFPDAVLRVTKALDDENCDVDKVAILVASEPTLSAKLLKFANSAMLHRGDKPVTELRSAINRLGLDMVRNAAMSVAMEQLLLAREHDDIRNLMGQLWRHSVKVAAISYTIAQRHDNLNPDEAFLAGLVHDIGKVYIWTRAKKYPDFLCDAKSMQSVTHDWHPSIGKAVLENWEFSDDILAATEGHESFGEEAFGPPDLVSVVAVANFLAKLPEGVMPEDEEIFGSAPFRRLGLDLAGCETLMADSEANAKSLGNALGR